MTLNSWTLPVPGAQASLRSSVFGRVSRDLLEHALELVLEFADRIIAELDRRDGDSDFEPESLERDDSDFEPEEGV